MQPAEANAQSAIDTTIRVAQEKLGTRLRAVFAMGSLGYGGFVAGWSDADIDLIAHDRGERVDDLLSEGCTIRDIIHRLGYPEVDIKCYTTATLNDPSSNFEYGIANRAVMLLESARLLFGEDIRGEVNLPDRRTLSSEAITVATGLRDKPDSWWASRPLDDTAALLALSGRLLITCETGKVVGKTAALELLLRDYGETVPAGTWSWLTWALAVRTTPLARILPSASMPEAQQAARSLMTWVVPLLKNLRTDSTN